MTEMTKKPMAENIIAKMYWDDSLSVVVVVVVEVDC